ncbi:MBL fold metallo-hydrolase [Radiobacillus kanasensis]|uniref:MBL fold metallo-hydrolase n=1 Tax=Radiobacillus kanasensis TaxID=2844358 RepID=UPI001E4434E1|nr:MBL fold metallo-hydrolase [Radiobacillus kanasensis]UFT99276.1 MBL fold metallo-hydrolase [Radiobacillus kanasensis]
MTTITFYGGLRTIGGTIISVQHKESRVIFDFGLSYNPATQVLDGQIRQRSSALTRDYLRLGLLPPIDGIYSKDAIPQDSSILSAQNYEGKTAILISHLHLDHMGAMGFIDSSIPVFMTEDSNRLYGALHTIGEGSPGDRVYQTCKVGEPITVGAITITPLPIDHDIPGACSFHIETPDGSLLYSGDVRLHGAHPHRVQLFLDQANEKGFDVLIMEGTTLRDEKELPNHELVADPTIPDDLLTEALLPNQVTDILRSISGIGVFNIYHRNIDRIRNMIMAGKEANRKVVLEVETAEIAFNWLEESDFYIYESEKLRAEYNDLPVWKKHLIERYPTISSKEINKDPHGYFLQNSYPNALELLDIHATDGVYIHSNGVPLGPFDPAYENLNRLLQIVGLEKVQINCGGHALPQHLQYLVDELNPATLIPLHSFFPERLMPPNGIQLLPEYEKVYRLLDGRLTEL